MRVGEALDATEGNCRARVEVWVRVKAAGRRVIIAPKPRVTDTTESLKAIYNRCSIPSNSRRVPRE